MLKGKLTYTQIIALSFFGMVLTGSVLLTLPIASRQGLWTPYIDALFTATSATCVTGLTVFDTAMHWSLFGQLVILTLIQIGGLGFMTIVSMMAVFLRKQIGLYERRLLMQTAGNTKLSGGVRLVRRIAFGTLLFEGAGTLLLSLRLCPQFGFSRGLYLSLFHSVSAFCNAGFDIMPGEFTSLTAYAKDPLVLLTLTALIVMGGLGFFVWSDILNNRLHVRRYALHTKIVLCVTGLLLLVSAVLFFVLEYHNTFSDMTLGQKLVASFFQSATPRTAGFNIVDTASMRNASSLLSIVLMFIGAGPGSTGGGVKVTTFTVVLLGMLAAARHKDGVYMFKRRLDEGAVKQASAITTIYLCAAVISTVLLCALQPFTVEDALFEVVSAMGTVGLSNGITPALHVVSKFVLMLLMFGGRVGGLSLALVLAEKRIKVPLDRPSEKILIG